jgi:NTE family protein
MPTAICLSGGGAKGDFEVGALRLLYDRGVRPNILAGTSVGAINAVKLAEGEDPANPRQGLAGLETIWASLRRNEDMYLEEDWLHDPDMDPRVRDALAGNAVNLGIAGPRDYPEWGDLSWLVSGISQLSWLLSDGQALLKSLGVFARRARAIYNLNPIAAKLATELDPAKVTRWGSNRRTPFAAWDGRAGEWKASLLHGEW